MARPKKTPDNQVKKHSAAIQIEGKITLLQRKTWNALLWHAYNDLSTKDIHEISVLDAMRFVGYESHDDDYFKAALEALAGCKVKWNILDKDGAPEWGFAVLLASANIKNGHCSYGFAPHLRQKLYNPDVYARIDLDLQKRFGSKYSLALWELCTDYLGGKREAGETPWIAVAEFRKLMGVEGGIYDSFKRVTERVISPALAEVNHVSDFRVTVEHQRQGRKVTALKFKMRRVAMLPEPENMQTSFFPDLDDMPPVVRELGDAGLMKKDAWEIWQMGFAVVDEAVRPAPIGDVDKAFHRYVQEKIHLLKRRQAAGKIENITGFLREAIKRNYANPEFGQEGERRKIAEARQAEKLRKEEKQQLQKQLERQLEELKRSNDRALSALFDEMAASFSEELETALPGLLAERPFLRQFHKSDQSALENYRSSHVLAAELNRHLESCAPARIQPVKERHAVQIAAMEEKIAALSQ